MTFLMTDWLIHQADDLHDEWARAVLLDARRREEAGAAPAHAMDAALRAHPRQGRTARGAA